MENTSIKIFVFGSNLAGFHGRGAAAAARIIYGARNGVGFGRTGNAYAIPTKDEKLRRLPIRQIRKFVEAFIRYAKDNPELNFFVTEIGCGLARYEPRDIAPLFFGAPPNCQLPKKFIEVHANIQSKMLV